MLQCSMQKRTTDFVSASSHSHTLFTAHTEFCFFNPRKEEKRMSNLDILRQASQEVDLETSMTSLDGLLDSVQEVAIERGFKSPDRQRSLDSLQSPSHTTGRSSSPTVRGDLNRVASQSSMHSPRRASPAGKIDGGGGSPRTSKATTSPPPRGASANFAFAI